jgi:hypothetical protein
MADVKRGERNDELARREGRMMDEIPGGELKYT